MRQLDVAEQTWSGSPSLAELRTRIEPLRQTVTLQHTTRKRLARFRTLRTEAGFLVMGLAGTNEEARLPRARAVVDEALTLGGSHPEFGPQPLREVSALSAEEQQEVREGCCEMLLGLAQLTEQAAAPGVGAHPSTTQEALNLVELAAQQGTAQALCHARRARYLDRLGRAEDARAARVLAQSCPPTRAFEFFLTGNDRYADGDLAGAVEAFEKALSREPNHAAAAYALALPHLRLRLQAEDAVVARAHLVVARMSLTACINHQPDLSWPYLCRAFAQGELGEVTAAEADFACAEQVLRHHPDSVARYALLVSRGALRIRRGDLDQAVADLTEAMGLEPQDYQAHVNLARAYQGKEDNASALSHLDRALLLGPPAAQAALYRTRARLHQEAGRTAAAARDLAEAANREMGGPRSALAVEDQFARGRLLAQAHDYEGAIAAFAAVLSVRPDHPGALRARAEALMRVHRSQDALVDLDRLLEQERGRQTEEAPLYRARAALRARAGDHQGAVEDYTLALRLVPEAASYNNRGWEYLALEAPALALADCERALRLKPDDSDALLGRGSARVKLGSYREAVTDVEQALRSGPVSTRSAYHAARVYSLASRLAAEDTPANAAGRNLALHYQDQAIALLRDAVAVLPPQERADFWSSTVRRDVAFNSVRACQGYRQLAEAIPASTPER